MSVTTEIVTMTPTDAMAALETNSANRNIRRSRVDQYARDMKAGAWKLNGDAIKFNGKGTLLDGQHRLLACVLASKPFETIVVRGLSEAVHPTIDTGAARTLGDELKFLGEKDCNNLSSGINLVWAYDNGVVGMGNNTMTRLEGLSILRKQPEIRDAVRMAGPASKEVGALRSSLIATAHLIQREHGAEKMHEFLDELQAGVGYQEGHPMLALRNYATAANSRRMFRPRREEWFAVMVKTANAWLLERPIKNLKWARVGRNAESFPQLLSKDDIGA